MEEKTRIPVWRKVLAAADLLCVTGAIIFLIIAIFQGTLQEGLHTVFRFVSWALVGVHFVLHGILNWEEHRWTAAFELGAVALMLALVAYITLTR